MTGLNGIRPQALNIQTLKHQPQRQTPYFSASGAGKAPNAKSGGFGWWLTMGSFMLTTLGGCFGNPLAGLNSPQGQKIAENVNPLTAMTQAQRNVMACYNDGTPEPVVTAHSASELADYLRPRTVHVLVDMPDIQKTQAAADKDASKKKEGEETEDAFKHFLSGTGSGFFCKPNGEFFTSLHVVTEALENNQPIIVTLEDKSEYEAEILATDKRGDLAYLRLKNVEKGRTFPTVHLVADSNKLQQGDSIYAMGHPYGNPWTFSPGLLSSKKREMMVIEDVTIFPLQVTTSIAPGNSGGPGTNHKGELVGISYAINGRVGNVNYMIPANRIADFIAVARAGLPQDNLLIGAEVVDQAYSDMESAMNNLRHNMKLSEEAKIMMSDMSERLQAGTYIQDVIDGKLDKYLKTMMDEKMLEENKKVMKNTLENGNPKDIALIKSQIRMSLFNQQYSVERITKELIKEMEVLEKDYAEASKNVQGKKIKGGAVLRDIKTHIPEDSETPSLASEAGLQAYDVVTHFNGIEVDGKTLLSRVHSAYKFETVVLTILRDGQTMDVTVNPDGFERLVAEMNNAKVETTEAE